MNSSVKLQKALSVSEALMSALQINNENISLVMMSQLDQLQLKCFQLMYTAAAVVVTLISRTKWRKRRQKHREGHEDVMGVIFFFSFRLILALSLGGKKWWHQKRPERWDATKDKCGVMAAAPQADALLAQQNT